MEMKLTSKLRLDSEPRSSLVDEGPKSIGVQKTAAQNAMEIQIYQDAMEVGDLSETCSGKSLSPPRGVDTPKFSVQHISNAFKFAFRKAIHLYPKATTLGHLKEGFEYEHCCRFASLLGSVKNISFRG